MPVDSSLFYSYKSKSRSRMANRVEYKYPLQFFQLQVILLLTSFVLFVLENKNCFPNICIGLRIQFPHCLTLIYFWSYLSFFLFYLDSYVDRLFYFPNLAAVSFYRACNLQKKYCKTAINNFRDNGPMPDNRDK